MKLSVIILNYYSAGLVKQCLRGLTAAKLALSYEVIVVDNASHDGCLEAVAREWPEAKRVALPSNRGYAAGNNAGLRVAQGDYVLILNPDIAILPGTLERLVAFMDGKPKAGLVGPRLVNPDGSLQYSCYHFPSFLLPLFRRTPLGKLSLFRRWLEHYQMLAWDHRQSKQVDWLLGACLLARRTVLSGVGLLDERYFLYVEDTDWCRRFWAAGFEVWYAAEVEIVHYHERLSAQASFSAVWKRITWIHIASWLKYFSKWGLTVPDYTHQRNTQTNA
jgi:N-acetylglucosaminyl-diphospho-decaprenol L-rhamnosyltransferase